MASLFRKNICCICGGTGKILGAGFMPKKCLACNGTGKRVIVDPEPLQRVEEPKKKPGRPPKKAYEPEKTSSSVE
jgi:hypothetical protein